MTGWLADFFRFWWGLLYWNWRKMRFQQKGRRGRCPCQSPSDSGKGYETQCEAAMSWVNQRRFKRLCPLLVETPQGLRCAAHTAEVRPFWRIPLAYYGGACLSLYLILTLGAFVFLRTLGYPIGYGTVSWPGYWHEFPKIQAQYYKDRGMKAYQAGDLRGASMSLYLAHSIDPSLYDCALINAQISTLAAPNQADETFRVLMQQHPEQADNTAEFWLRSIVARGSFNALRGLALERLQNAKSGSPAPWLHALLIATRQLGDSNSLAKFAQSPKGEPWRTLLQTELLLRADRNEEATQALLQAWQPQDTYKAYYQCWQLIGLKKPREALAVLSGYNHLIPDEEKLSIYLACRRLGGVNESWRQEILSLLASKPGNAALIELLATHLVKFPNLLLTQDVLGQLTQNPLPKNDTGMRATLSLYCAAGATGDIGLMDQIAFKLREQSGANFLILDLAKLYFSENKTKIRLEDFLSSMPMSLELQYALYERQRLQRAEQVRSVKGIQVPKRSP